MRERLRQQVLEANGQLVLLGLTHASFGNVSGVDREDGVVAIKPSGVTYSDLAADDVAIVSLESGEHLAGLRPSSNTPTHLELYRAFEEIGGIAHTHSTYATSWAQTRRPIPCFDTTHADYLFGPVPCTRRLTDEECGDDYELRTGLAIVEALSGLDPLERPAVLVASHGAFARGSSATEAVEHAAALEEIARLAFNTMTLDPDPSPLSSALLERNLHRKHGPTAYYGQQ